MKLTFNTVDKHLLELLDALVDVTRRGLPKFSSIICILHVKIRFLSRKRSKKKQNSERWSVHRVAYYPSCPFSEISFFLLCAIYV